MKNNSYDLRTNQYSPELEGEVISRGASTNTGPQILTSNRDSQTKIFGVDGVCDCIGIIGWHEKTKTVHLYHINEVDLFRLGGTFFSLLETISEDELVKQGAKNCFSSIMKGGYMAADRQVNYLCKTYYAETLQSSNNPLKEMRYTLVTQDERNVKDLLDVFELFGIEKSQISIDLHESQLFIDRETGAISNSHNDYHKDQSVSTDGKAGYCRNTNQSIPNRGRINFSVTTRNNKTANA